MKLTPGKLISRTVPDLTIPVTVLGDIPESLSRREVYARIDGCTEGNRFALKDWDFEPDPPTLTRVEAIKALPIGTVFNLFPAETHYYTYVKISDDEVVGIYFYNGTRTVWTVPIDTRQFGTEVAGPDFPVITEPGNR